MKRPWRRSPKRRLKKRVQLVDLRDMLWNTGEPALSTARAASRYGFAVPMSVELPNGIFRTADRVDAYLVDLSEGGAGLVLPADSRLRPKKRLRVLIDDHSGIIEIRNVTQLTEGQVRIGAAFKSLGLELQELVADSIQSARVENSRLTRTTVNSQ